jgi:hypothetical protein
MEPTSMQLLDQVEEQLFTTRNKNMMLIILWLLSLKALERLKLALICKFMCILLSFRKIQILGT